MVILFLVSIGFVIVSSQYKNVSLFILLVVGYVINLLALYFNYNVKSIFTSSDQLRFLELAQTLADLDFYSYLLQFDPTGSYVISWFAAFVFKVFGKELVYVNLFFIYAWLGTIVYSYKICYLTTKNKRKSLLIVAFLIFLPSAIIVNMAFLRESFVIFFFTASMYFSYLWFLRNKQADFIKAILFAVGAGFFHGVFYIVAIYLLVYYFKRSFSRYSIRYIDLLVLLMLVPVISGASLKLVDNVKIKMAIALLSGKSEAVQVYFTVEDRSDYDGINALSLPKIDSSNPLIFSMSLFERVLAFISSPFIHQVYKVTDIPRVYDSLVFIFAIIVFMINYKRSRNFKNLNVNFYFKFFIPIFFLLLIAFAFGSFDVGTSQRHRLKIMPVFMMLTFSLYYMLSTHYKGSKKKE